MTSAFPRNLAPLILPYEGVSPQFAAAPRRCGIRSSVLGKAQIGARLTLASHSVIRADGHVVRIGDDFHLGEFSTVHIAHDLYPALIGHRVTVGRNAVIHACTVGDKCVIEDDVVILDGSILESGIAIEARSTVFPRSMLMSGGVYSGSPAKLIRDLAPGELSEREARLQAPNAHSGTRGSCSFIDSDDTPIAYDFPDDVFVAETACFGGRVELGRRASVFFGCHLDAGKASIVIGERSNIQDNTMIKCAGDAVSVGSDTTIGHNVRLRSCRIGRRTLVGIGSILSAGTVIDDDVLLAAGSRTNQGQHIGGGWVWGGRPAQAISKLDDTKRGMMSQIVDYYQAYANSYHCAQRLLAPVRE